MAWIAADFVRAEKPPPVQALGVSSLDQSQKGSGRVQPVGHSPNACMFLTRVLVTVDRLCMFASSVRQFVKRWAALVPILEAEMSVLAALIRRNQSRFRNDKGLKAAKLVLKCVRRLLEMDLGRRVVGEAYLESSLPIVLSIKRQDRIYLPTRPMATFVQKRLTGGFLLMEKLVTYCRIAGELALNRLAIGHVWSNGLTNMAIFSRIW